MNKEQLIKDLIASHEKIAIESIRQYYASNSENNVTRAMPGSVSDYTKMFLDKVAKIVAEL